MQRLVADGYDKLYATRQWLDTKFDDRDETIREVLNDYDKTELKEELLGNISESVGFNVSNVVELNNPAQMADQLMKDASGLLWPKSHKKRQLKSLLQTALPDLQNVTYPPGDREITVYEFRRKQMLSPNHLVKAEDDLNDGFNLLYCCALIAVYKSEGKGTVKAKLGIVKELGADAKYYEAMHDYYYGRKNIQYDEPVTHPGIYKEWGFSMIHAGHTSWANLKDVLKSSLRTGKKYIFDLDNHSVFVTMKKDFHPGSGPGDETFASFFNFHSDPNNFNTGELKQYVEYIYEK